MLKFILSSLLLFSQSWAHEYLETKTHTDVLSKASELTAKYGARNVLIVFDIDNTLLKAKQPLGSDQWFEWQAQAIKESSQEANFTSLDELLKAQANFFQISSMDLTETAIPQMMKNLKNEGHKIILLTSRGPMMRNVTERELDRNGLWFSDSSIMEGIPYSFSETPFNSRVSFMNGIFMTSGHHKGEALDYLLRRAQKKYKAIIFADDHEKHTRRVYETFSKNKDVEIVTFRYGREDKNVEAFKLSSKRDVNAQTENFLDLIQTTFNI